MQINTINKYLLISLIILVQFGFIGCKADTVKLPEVFQEYLLTKNQDVFNNSIGKRVESFNDPNIGFRNQSVKINNELFYVNSYVLRDDFSSGNFVTLTLVKKTKKDEYSILMDIIHFESNKGLYVEINNLRYGEKDMSGYHYLDGKKTYGYYHLDETKFGIYDIDLSKGLPFYQKIIPRYIISVENGKLKVEVPKNDDYFIYLYDEI